MYLKGFVIIGLLIILGVFCAVKNIIKFIIFAEVLTLFGVLILACRCRIFSDRRLILIILLVSACEAAIKLSLLIVFVNNGCLLNQKIKFFLNRK